VTVKTSTSADAIIIASSSHHDAEARLAGHWNGESVHGFRHMPVKMPGQRLWKEYP